jgi:outer membrane protein W
MKKIVGLAVAALLATAAPAAAGFHIGFGGGYAMPLDANQSQGPALAAHLGFDLTPNLALEIGALGYQTSVTASGAGLMKGTLAVIPIEMSLKLHVPVSSALELFVAAGGGAYLSRFTQDATAAQTWASVGFTPSEKLNTAYGFHVRGGLELALSRSVGLVLEARYATAKADGTWTLTDDMGGPSVSGKITGFNLDAVVIGLGLNIAL